MNTVTLPLLALKTSTNRTVQLVGDLHGDGHGILTILANGASTSYTVERIGSDWGDGFKLTKRDAHSGPAQGGNGVGRNNQRHGGEEAEAQPQGGTPMNPLLTVNETCARLHVSRKTLYALMKSGQLPSLKLRGARRIRPRDVERLIDRKVKVGW